MTGNNLGIMKSQTNFVMILNPDTVLKPNTLNELYEVSKNLDFSILCPINSDKQYPNFSSKQIKQQNIFNKDLQRPIELTDMQWCLINQNLKIIFLMKIFLCI